MKLKNFKYPFLKKTDVKINEKSYFYPKKNKNTFF